MREVCAVCGRPRPGPWTAPQEASAIAAVRISGWHGVRARATRAATGGGAGGGAGGGGEPPAMSAAMVAPWYWLRDETGAARECMVAHRAAASQARVLPTRSELTLATLARLSRLGAPLPPLPLPPAMPPEAGPEAAGLERGVRKGSLDPAWCEARCEPARSLEAVGVGVGVGEAPCEVGSAEARRGSALGCACFVVLTAAAAGLLEPVLLARVGEAPAETAVEIEKALEMANSRSRVPSSPRRSRRASLTSKCDVRSERGLILRL